MARKKHPLAETSLRFWLGGNRAELKYDALYKRLKLHARNAGLPEFHPHMLRHTAAVRWIAAGGTTSGLMAQCGWTDADMVRRYIAAAAEELAIAEVTG